MKTVYEFLSSGGKDGLLWEVVGGQPRRKQSPPQQEESPSIKDWPKSITIIHGLNNIAALCIVTLPGVKSSFGQGHERRIAPSVLL